MDQVTKAVELFGQGYMCSQAVFAAFSEQFGITEKQALRIGACFGGGLCGSDLIAVNHTGKGKDSNDPEKTGFTE